MDLQAEAERRKRADILASEGHREAAVNTAEGQRRSVILEAEGEAEAILARARASARALEVLSAAIGKSGGTSAVSMRLAEQYIESFGKLAKRSTTVVLPADAGNPASIVAQAMSVFQSIKGNPALRIEGTAHAAEELRDEEPNEETPADSASRSAASAPFRPAPLPPTGSHDSTSSFAAHSAPSDAGATFTPKPLPPAL